MTRTIKAFKIPCNGQLPELVEIPDELEVYQEFVGGYIEIVRVPPKPIMFVNDTGLIETVRVPPDVIMVVNDTGLIDELPINLIASMFYPGATPICGNAWIVGDHHDENFHDVPDELINFLTKLDKIIL